MPRVAGRASGSLRALVFFLGAMGSPHTLNQSCRARQTMFRAVSERFEIFAGALDLSRRVSGLHHGLTISLRGRATFRIPIDVFARDPDSRLFPIESMQIAQMGEHDITDFCDG